MPLNIQPRAVSLLDVPGSGKPRSHVVVATICAGDHLWDRTAAGISVPFSNTRPQLTGAILPKIRIPIMYSRPNFAVNQTHETLFIPYGFLVITAGLARRLNHNQRHAYMTLYESFTRVRSSVFGRECMINSKLFISPGRRQHCLIAGPRSGLEAEIAVQIPGFHVCRSPHLPPLQAGREISAEANQWLQSSLRPFPLLIRGELRQSGYAVPLDPPIYQAILRPPLRPDQTSGHLPASCAPPRDVGSLSGRP
ncbi:hypothetical protein DFH09DRAFT_1281335 [Mycena vulgaris]|nr:hypothetical protein DFH09DRAFT_1281335 [Mycena vulgaris]